MKHYIAVIMPLLLCVIFFGLVLSTQQSASAFAQEYQYSTYEPAGFFSGVWNGLLAPWTLIARWFMNDIVMYAIPNTGWFYDFGFLLGIILSVPIGWVFALLSLAAHIMNFI